LLNSCFIDKLTFLQIFYHSLLAFDALIHVQILLNFILWSCTLEHILTHPIFLQYFVIIKTLEELYKTNFVPTNFMVTKTKSRNFYRTKNTFNP